MRLTQLLMILFFFVVFSSGFAQASISEAQFNEVIDQVKVLYEPLIESHGGKLWIIRQWGNNTPAADSSESVFTPGRKTMLFTGGLARRPEMTADAFMLIACHEMGHHLGGFPLSGSFVFGKMAVEGEADYFATHVCARKVFKAYKDESKNEEAAKRVDPYAKGLCDQVWQTKEDQNICYRVTVAITAMWNTKAHLTGEAEPKFNHPDQRRVIYQTNSDHPQVQCRMDTSLQGALCTAPFDESLIPQTEAEMAKQSCTRSGKYTWGVRPLCWFKPTLD